MVIFKNKNNPWVFMPICSASVEGHEKLLKISVCKFHKLFRNTNQLNLSPIKSYINNWAMDNSRASCFCLLECAQLEVVREITMGMDYPVYLCYGNVQLFVIFFFFALYLPSKQPVGSFLRPTTAFLPPSLLPCKSADKLWRRIERSSLLPPSFLPPQGFQCQYL